MDIALIAPVESNYKNLNTQLGTANGEPRLYEYEAIRCFRSWRKNGGWLKDIPIYCACFTQNRPCAETVREFENLGVRYIENYMPDTQNFSSGFLQIPLCGKFFETFDGIKENTLVKIDLDAELMRPFPEKWFENIEKSTIVGQYNDQYDNDERFVFDAFPFDTSLIITDRRNRFYAKYYGLCFSEDVLESDEWRKVRAVDGDYWLEEFVVDWMYEKKISDITPVQDYQTGFGYPSLEYFAKNRKLDKVYLRHSHIIP